MAPTVPKVKVADEVWIVTALLHRESPRKADFTIHEILARADKEKVFGQLRPGVQVHASLHCGANRAPNPGAYWMLSATGKRTRRLCRPDDEAHPDRDGKMIPNREEIPSRYHGLLDWYERAYAHNQQAAEARYAPLHRLFGLGRAVWKGVDPDAYVRSLRQD